MSRIAAREVAVHIVYDYGFNNEVGDEALRYLLSDEFAESVSKDTEIYSNVGDEQKDYIRAVVNGIKENRDAIDEKIRKYSVGWDIKRISKIAMAIMRVAVFEAENIDDVPAGVAINEAVEIAKKYDTAETVSFINGILGSIVRDTQGE